MKRLMLALMLVLAMSCVCFGAVSEDMSVYLRKDVFDAKMDAFMSEIRGEFQVMNAKIDALSRRVEDNYNALSKRIDDNYNTLSKRIDDNYNALSKRIDDNNRALESRMDVLDTKIDGVNKRIDGVDKRFDGLDKRVNDVRNEIYLLLVLLGIVVSLPFIQKKLQAFVERRESKRQFTTIEDVKRLIAENNARTVS